MEALGGEPAGQQDDANPDGGPVFADRRKVILHVTHDKVDREIMALYASLTQAINEVHSRYTDPEFALPGDDATRLADVMYQGLVRLRETITN